MPRFLPFLLPTLRVSSMRALYPANRFFFDFIDLRIFGTDYEASKIINLNYWY
jgi:hypothetical protein